jgi:hypothetical protein
MPDDKFDIKATQRELHEAIAAIAKVSGKEIPPFVEDEPPFCSFCGKGTNNVKRMIAGPAVHICDECVKLVSKLVDK